MEDEVHDIISNVTISTVRRILPPTKSRHKRQINSYASVFDENSKLRWEKWNGFLPNGTVSIHNSYDGRIDFVCKFKCHSGFYNPSKGRYCHYPFDNTEHRAVNSFEVLVNQDDFELLEWKEGSYGSVPEQSIQTCFTEKMYVGKNKYGLGKVYPKYQCFYLPWEGDEYWYKRRYEVLTISTDARREEIFNVKYDIKQAEMLNTPPKVLKKSVISNAGCQPVLKTLELSTRSQETNTWDIGFSLMTGVKATLKAGIPSVVEGSTEIALETTFQYSKGSSVTEEVTYTVSFTYNVPPNHRCIIHVMCKEYKNKIPFTARLSRTYGNGETRWTTLSGTYRGVQISDLHIELGRCEPLPDTKPCPSME